MTIPATPRYRERLRVPVHWWLTPIFFVLVIAIGWYVYVGFAAMVIATVVFVAVLIAGLIGYGALELTVDADGFRAGDALLPIAHVGPVYPLDKAQAFALRGPRADARARIVLRGYIAGAVRIDVLDPTVREPYWYVSTRHPHALAAALGAARDADRGPAQERRPPI